MLPACRPGDPEGLGMCLGQLGQDRLRQAVHQGACRPARLAQALDVRQTQVWHQQGLQGL